MEKSKIYFTVCLFIWFIWSLIYLGLSYLITGRTGHLFETVWEYCIFTWFTLIGTAITMIFITYRYFSSYLKYKWKILTIFISIATCYTIYFLLTWPLVEDTTIYARLYKP